MTLEELKNELDQLIGQTVVFKRIAVNHIIIYFGGEPGDDTVISFFIDPTWRYHKDGKVVIGSYDLPFDESDFKSEEEYQEKFEHLASLTDNIFDSELISYTVDPESFDITLEFSGNQKVCNFANSGFKDQCWTYRNVPKQLTAYVSPQGIILK